MKRTCLLLGLAVATVAAADVPPSGVVSDPLALDIESGVRSEEIVGALSYDTLWSGVTNADFRILVNGAVLASGSGAGTVAWHPTKYGTYALTYQAFVDNVKVGEDLSATFTLAGKDLVDAEITLAADEVLYDGTAQCPRATIVYQSETLVDGVDYALEYGNNVNPGVATMTIRGKGRFSDVLEKSFTIRPAGICSLDVESGMRVARATESLAYDSSWFAEANSSYKMYVDGKELTTGSGMGAYDWIPRAVGDHLLTYRSYSGGYLVSDEYQARFHVNGQDLVHATVTFEDESILYDGTGREPYVTITLDGKTLVEGTDYSLEYSNNVDPGVGFVTVTGLGPYVDILDVPFTIRPAGICFLDIESGVRSATGTVPLYYDETWNGDANAATFMDILHESGDGTETMLVDSLTESGEYAFAPKKSETCKVTLVTYVRGKMQTGEKIYTARFNCSPSADSTYELSLVSAVARQRYPWNGKVDVDCELKGDPAQKYLVSLTAKDLDGGAALPMKTAWAVGGDVTNSVFSLAPGRHRFVWDADADIASDGDFPRVAVSVTAEGGPLVGYSRRMAISVDGYAGSEALTNVPVLVRLSTAIAGFDYGDFASPSNGADLAFFDAGDRRLAYEIDEWNTNGESLVWVKLPELMRGTRFTAAWGAESASMYGRDTGRGSAVGQAVWRDYAGVWHMNEESGVAYDSTANGLDAQPDCGTNKTVDVRSEMVGVAGGAVGVARQNEVSEVNATKGSGNYLSVPSYDDLALGGQFVVSGWFKAKAIVEFPRMISRKNVSSDTNGWEIHPRKNSCTTMSVRGASSGSVICETPDFSAGWVNVACVYSGDVFECYTNGVVSVKTALSSSEVAEATDNGLPLAFGCSPDGSENTWCGWYDEIRLRGGTLSADRIKADYDMVADRVFLGYGEVTKGAEAAE